MIKKEIISYYLENNKLLPIGDGYLSKFILKNKHKIFRFQSTPAKNMTYDSNFMESAGYSDYKIDRTNLISNFHNYMEVNNWECLK